MGLQADQRVLKDLVEEKLPRLAAHLVQHGVDVTLVTFHWFLVVFVENLPGHVLLPLWDAFLYEGSKVCVEEEWAGLKQVWLQWAGLSGGLQMRWAVLTQGGGAVSGGLLVSWARLTKGGGVVSGGLQVRPGAAQVQGGGAAAAARRLGPLPLPALLPQDCD